MVLLKTNSYSHNHHPLCKKIGYKIITRNYPGGDKLSDIGKQIANVIMKPLEGRLLNSILNPKQLDKLPANYDFILGPLVKRFYEQGSHNPHMDAFLALHKRKRYLFPPMSKENNTKIQEAISSYYPDIESNKLGEEILRLISNERQIPIKYIKEYLEYIQKESYIYTPHDVALLKQIEEHLNIPDFTKDMTVVQKTHDSVSERISDFLSKKESSRLFTSEDYTQHKKIWEEAIYILENFFEHFTEEQILQFLERCGIIEFPDATYYCSNTGKILTEERGCGPKILQKIYDMLKDSKYKALFCNKDDTLLSEKMKSFILDLIENNQLEFYITKIVCGLNDKDSILSGENLHLILAVPHPEKQTHILGIGNYTSARDSLTIFINEIQKLLPCPILTLTEQQKQHNTGVYNKYDYNPEDVTNDFAERENKKEQRFRIFETIKEYPRQLMIFHPSATNHLHYDTTVNGRPIIEVVKEALRQKWSSSDLTITEDCRKFDFTLLAKCAKIVIQEKINNIDEIIIRRTSLTPKKQNDKNQLLQKQKNNYLKKEREKLYRDGLSEPQKLFYEIRNQLQENIKKKAKEEKLKQESSLDKDSSHKKLNTNDQNNDAGEII